MSGTEEDMQFRVPAEAWASKTDDIEKFVKSGGELAPLIAEYKAGMLLLADGSHRHEGLRKAGHDSYWTIIWYNSRLDWETHEVAT